MTFDGGGAQRDHDSLLTPLESILSAYRTNARTEREKGTYFESLVRCYFENEPAYRDLYSGVWTYADWAKSQGQNAQDVGIDLVAMTFTGELHAIQCKLYASDYTLQKRDIDSFFTASGKKIFSRRIIVSSTTYWSTHAREALADQVPPVTRINLRDLEASLVDWSKFAPSRPAALRPKKTLRSHQKSALEAVRDGLAKADRGKLLMACGTGKTFTALKVAEDQAGKGKRVLFLVPSLSLLSQTLTEWTQESSLPIHSFAVCSDSDIGKKRQSDEDRVQLLIHELRYPATTDAASLAREVAKRHEQSHMTVVFSTYHSIEVLHRAQRKHGLPAFDLVICDEAHRTTGAVFEDEQESAFVKVHDAKYLLGHKRLYMTATPRIYGEGAKAIAERDNTALCSMDDSTLYGETLYVLTFSNAVTQRLLVDYKVVVLAVDEAHVNRRLQKLLSDDENQLRVDDAAKIVGCWKALAKQGLTHDLAGDDQPMKRAVAFCQVIAHNPKAKVHKVASKNIASMFQAVVEAYQELDDIESAARLRCEAQHVDGTMIASEKEEKLDWLKADAGEGTCRILSNVRCLSEGVDVPALDAVLFLTPRSSQVDVVQSVGRVMRNAPGKQRGHVVIPVVIPAGLEPHEALNDNKTYAVVWQVLQALRSHDDRFDAMVNKMELEVNRKMVSKMEVVAITDKAPARPAKGSSAARSASAARGGNTIGRPAGGRPDAQQELPFDIGELERAIYAKVVQKCGSRRHWEDWAKDIAKIARTHIDRIAAILEDETNEREREAFGRLAEELRDDLNDSITDAEIVEMLAQHLVTKPVFDALFGGHSFTAENSMSRAMQEVVDALAVHRLEKEASTLEEFYASVKMRAEGIESAEGRQKIVVELYDKFFRNAFPKMSERLGIVYTPVEIVDFILKSVDHLLRVEFGQDLNSEGVHVIDPFTGTGTFITRLMQSGLISKETLPRKYAKEIHANELVLLAYYIAAINIEAAYHGVVGGKYQPFEGICLTDTFQLYEKDDLVSRVLVDNSARRTRQKKLDIRVVVGNPPYSVGQDSENDNNANVEYPSLDARIAETYAAKSQAKLAKGLYDSYVRAIRWASDRVGERGVIGFVTNANFIEANTTDGLRKCLADEFSDLYVFHLRGNARTSGERRRREAGNAFGAGSRAPIAISLLVKNKNAGKRRRIFFRDVGDYLSREEKLKAVSDLGSVDGVSRAAGWTMVEPDEHGDWLKQRDDSFNRHIPMGSKDKADDSVRLFETFSLGVVTNRDAWAGSPSKRSAASNMRRMIETYAAELARLSKKHMGLDKSERAAKIDDFIDTDPRKIAWTRALKNELAKGTEIKFESARLVPSLYRPFFKQWLYFDRLLNEMVYQTPKLFPSAGTDNRVIGVSASESRSGYSVLMTNVLPSLHATDMVGSQYFPMFTYGVGDEGHEKMTRREAITDAGLAQFRDAYPTDAVSKEDLFYYVYGILHASDYRERYADNLGKELPRIPRVRTAKDFWAFSRAGRKLGDLHVGYEDVPEFEAELDKPSRPTGAQYRVEKMRFGRGSGGKDKTVILYNDHVTVRSIPIEAYDYVVNGKSAVEWVMDRQTVTTDKDSGIVKDANDWATETAGDARYPLSLLLRVVTVSLETMKVVRALPALDITE